MKRTSKRNSAKRKGPKFGGRSTAVGVGYEAQVAASIASKMLGGDYYVVWDGINGEDIAAITMQDAEPVDDVVITLRGKLQPKVFISALLCGSSTSLRLHNGQGVGFCGRCPRLLALA